MSIYCNKDFCENFCYIPRPFFVAKKQHFGSDVAIYIFMCVCVCV